VIICRSPLELRHARARLAEPVGFVPTMGALHAGHESLVARARKECASVIASTFVNPLQFGPNDDFEKYPRDLDADVAVLERHGVDVVFAPDVASMYPTGSQVTVDPGPLADVLEGDRRPGHFRGVATIVLKLFNLAAPDNAYFGEKDAQQLAVVRKMANDLNIPVAIVGCATVRERDGLAISSRNRYLTPAQRQDAAGLSRALKFIVEAIERGAADVGAVLRGATIELGSLQVDYLAVVDPDAFVPLKSLPARSGLLAVGAAFCGTTRLIDNMPLHTT
jgi:pantoate--beta-alanine ligase